MYLRTFSAHRQHLMFSKLHRSTVRINAELVLEIPLEPGSAQEKYMLLAETNNINPQKRVLSQVVLFPRGGL